MAQRARKPTPVLPDRVTPGEAATDANIIEAIGIETVRYQRQLQILRDGAVKQYRDGPVCYDGITEFLGEFPVLAAGSDDAEGEDDDDYDYEDEDVKDAEVIITGEEFDPGYYTTAGLRHLLQARVVLHDAQLAKIREYAIERSDSVDLDMLNETLEAAGLEPFQPVLDYDAEISAHWTAVGNGSESGMDDAAGELEDKIRAAIRDIIQKMNGTEKNVRVDMSVEIA